MLLTKRSQDYLKELDLCLGILKAVLYIYICIYLYDIIIILILHNIFCKFYRFGKPRRGPDLNGTLSSEEDNSVEREREIARRNAREEQLRIQEQYQRLIQRQAEMVIIF